MCFYVCVFGEAWDLWSHRGEKYSPREEEGTAETNSSDYLAAGEKSNTPNNPRVLLCNCFHLQFIFCVCGVLVEGRGGCISQVWLWSIFLSRHVSSLCKAAALSFLPASMTERQSEPSIFNSMTQLNEVKGCFWLEEEMQHRGHLYGPGEISFKVLSRTE